MAYKEIDRLIYLDTLTELLDNGSLTIEQASVQYWEDFGIRGKLKEKGDKV